MSAPPFSLAETTPQDADVVLNYPLAERTFRGVVESWLTFISDPATGLLLPGKYPSITVQTFTTPGAITWTKPSGCQRIIPFGCGGGGGGGAVDGQSTGSAAGAGGGSSGAYGPINAFILDVTGVAGSTAGSIGAGGLAGAVPSGGGGTGGNTTITINGVVYTWAGGLGGFGQLASAVSFHMAFGSGINSGSLSVRSSSNPGRMGLAGYDSAATFSEASGGWGGSSPFAQGGAGTFALGAQADPGNAGQLGSGGSGGAVTDTSANAAGGAGGAGVLLIVELY